ncbi:hypothetical protein MUN81_15890 [Hymenobacter sp. 5317J-9]|uniref:hypothetical protein n=1 Tax=Hymenobacter sp. 5317J-9 TaxID=2932250 RepID=UPI001FD6CF9D|nr:hypothetical protein [Hymenobacter sp. 5317J-9]UOQ96717.1 hypothetical protein MUN81_15890 [Hymenobacter sp. 5317J-9]
MKKLATLIAFGFCCAATRPAQAQGPDRAEYQQRFNNCDAERQRLAGKLDALRAEKQTALRELQQGYFCSKCKHSKTTIEKGGENFEAHLGRVKGERVAATQAEIAQNQNEFQDKIHNLEVDVDSKRLDCERVSMDYQKAYKSAQDRAQQDAQRDADARAQHAADEQQKALAAQKQKEEEERQARLEEQRRREEAERLRQAQLAANYLRFEEQMRDNNAITQAKLEEARRNGNLNGINQYSDDSRRNARNTVDGTNSGTLRRQAMGDGSGGYLSQAADYIREKRDSYFNKVTTDYAEKKLNQLFDQDDDDDGEYAPNVDIKSEIKSDAIHYLKNKFVQSSGPTIKELDRKYQEAVDEYEKYEPISLPNAFSEASSSVFKQLNAIVSGASSEEVEQMQKEFWDKTPKRYWVGVPRYYLPGPSKALVKDLAGFFTFK